MGFFDTIISYIEQAWSFVSNLLTSLITLFTTIAGAVTLPAVLVGYMPEFLGACILAVGAIGIIKLVVGRDNS